jgi:hypothetical protein
MVSKSVLECPFCFEIFEVDSPDKAHTAYSSKKPNQEVFRANIVKKRHRCKNPKCNKILTTYWYAPLDFLYEA